MRENRAEKERWNLTGYTKCLGLRSALIPQFLGLGESCIGFCYATEQLESHVTQFFIVALSIIVLPISSSRVEFVICIDLSKTPV